MYIARQPLLALKTDFISQRFPLSLFYVCRCQSRGCYFKVFSFLCVLTLKPFVGIEYVVFQMAKIEHNYVDSTEINLRLQQP